MKVILRPRQSGKTTEAVEWCKQDPKRLFVSMHRDMRDRVMGMGLPPDQFVYLKDLRMKTIGRSDCEIMLDDAEMALDSLLQSSGITVKIGGMVIEEKPEEVQREMQQEEYSTDIRVEDLPF